MSRIFFIVTTHAFLVSPSYAHVGHLGEVAGHAHWVGVAAIAGAAALGALAGKINKKTKEDRSAEDEASEEVHEGEAA